MRRAHGGRAAAQAARAILDGDKWCHDVQCCVMKLITGKKNIQKKKHSPKKRNIVYSVIIRPFKKKKENKKKSELRTALATKRNETLNAAL